MHLTILRDEELIFFINLKSSTALNVITERYKTRASFLVKEMLSQFPNSGISEDCLVNVCMNCLERSMVQAKRHKLPLNQYWKQIALHEAAKYLKENSYTFKSNPFVGLSLDAYVQLENDTVCICDSIGEDDQEDEEDLYNAIVKTINQGSFRLKQEDKNLFLCYIRGYEVEEIQEAFPEYSRSKIYRAIRNGRKLLAKEILK